MCKSFLVMVSFNNYHTMIREWIFYLWGMPCIAILVAYVSQYRGMLTWAMENLGQDLFPPRSCGLFLTCPWWEWIIWFLNLFHLWLCPCWVIWWIIVESAYCVYSCKLSRAESVASHVSLAKRYVRWVDCCNWYCKHCRYW